MRSSTAPTFVLPFPDQIQCFEVCQSDFAHNLICVATNKKLTLGLIWFPNELESESFEWERVKDIYHEARCDAICFSPDSTLLPMPKSVTLCVAGGDYILRIYRTDLYDSDTVQTLEGHTNYINDIAWDTESEHLASVSDDHTCKLWNAESHYEIVTTFCLTSAGMSVKWHPEEPWKVMVAEKKGVIRLYNVRSQQAILSLETSKKPIMYADWALNNRMFINAIAGGDIITWDLRHASTPADIKQVHEDGGRIVKFSPKSELVVASIGYPNITLKITTVKSPIPLLEAPLKSYGGLVWHSRLPYVLSAFDRKLCFWKVQIS